MKLQGHPISALCRWPLSAEVTQLGYDIDGLRIVVSGPAKTDEYTEIFFSHPFAFQVMDEGDMFTLWNENIGSSKHLIYRVDSGGWKDRVKDGFLSISGNDSEMKEWLVVTIGDCVSVLSPYAPEISEH